MKLYDNIKGVQHMGLPVSSLEETKRFYMENFGFEIYHEKELFYPERVKVCFLKLKDIVLEVYENQKEAVRKEVAANVTGVYDHFAIEAADFEDDARKLMEKGLRLAPATPNGAVFYENLKNKGIRGVNFVSPNGEVVELCCDNAKSYDGKNGLLGWDHLAVRTKNLKETMEFYAGIGFSQTGSGYLDTEDGRLEIVFMTCKGFTLELIQLVGEALSAPETWVNGKIDHIALDVEDINDAFLEARKQGYELLDFAVQELPFYDHGCRFFTIKGPNGEKVEFNQINKF